MVGFLVLMVLIGILGGASTWAKHQRVKRMYEEKYKDCCGTNCGCHDKEEKMK